MNKIYSKERSEEMRMRNVLKYLQERRNELIGKHKQAKKDKNKEEQARLLAEQRKLKALTEDYRLQRATLGQEINDINGLINKIRAEII